MIYNKNKCLSVNNVITSGRDKYIWPGNMNNEHKKKDFKGLTVYLV